ncbi:jg13396 [Pararge aegeria aegeria]|uniref:Jg13396 protein n=1 Tax=Pararge aegeria aegeria TaxID=348720 RepID=A0A8S4R9A7_9NEOP|nr:jg13396 [Pararge aegeria aegeria]
MRRTVEELKQREAEVAICGAQSSEKVWTLGYQGAGKRSVGRPPTRWTDDIKRDAVSRWIQAAPNRGIWSSLQKTCPVVDVYRFILLHSE